MGISRGYTYVYVKREVTLESGGWLLALMKTKYSRGAGAQIFESQTSFFKL